MERHSLLWREYALLALCAVANGVEQGLSDGESGVCHHIADRVFFIE